MLRTSIRLAIRGLQRNTLRTILTMLGMIIGVAAVMTMVALGNGAQQTVERDVRAAGTNLIHVDAGRRRRDRAAGPWHQERRACCQAARLDRLREPPLLRPGARYRRAVRRHV